MWHYRTRTTKRGSIARKYPRDDKSCDSSGKEERDDIEESVEGGGSQREDSNHVREADARSQVLWWWKMSYAVFFALALLALMPHVLLSDQQHKFERYRVDQGEGRKAYDPSHNASEADISLFQHAPPSHVTHWWTSTPEPWLPLVKPFGEQQNVLNKFTQEPIFYIPNEGYSFPLNGQGGTRRNKFYNKTVLQYKLEPDQVLTKDAARECLFRKNVSWVHIDGDSLARDVYYDLGELFGKGWNDKAKTLKDMSFTGNANIHFSFSSDTIKKLKQKPNWYARSRNGRYCPDLWIYSSGLWDHVEDPPISLERYRERTKLQELVASRQFSRNSVGNTDENK
jgi:hypothetical protein